MIRILISIPLLIILIAFALSNQQPEMFNFNVSSMLLVMVVLAAIFFVVGAVMTWTSAVASRSRARRAERHVRELQARIDAMRQQQVEELRTGRALVPAPPA